MRIVIMEDQNGFAGGMPERRGCGPKRMPCGPGFGGVEPMPFAPGLERRKQGFFAVPVPVMEREEYAELSNEKKLSAVLGELGHLEHFFFEHRGGQGRVLRLLREKGSMTQRALTAELGIMPGSASELLGKLERAGFIVRRPNPEDRRTVLVDLTEAGLARVLEKEEKRAERQKECYAALSEEEQDTLLALLEKLDISWQKRISEHREKRRAAAEAAETEEKKC